VILIGSGAAAVGILVDRISGQREIVVKTLRDPLVKVAGVSGATELGDGRLVLILDVAGLLRGLRGRNTPIRAAL
jgi:two-component system chemotaxis sensor kinase CheA